MLKLNIISDIPVTAVTIQNNTSVYTYGSTVMLTCATTSRPASTLSWTKNGVPITSSGNMKIAYSVEPVAHILTQSILVFSNLTLNNNGDYRCIAQYTTNGNTNTVQSSVFALSKSSLYFT